MSSFYLLKKSVPNSSTGILAQCFGLSILKKLAFGELIFQRINAHNNKDAHILQYGGSSLSNSKTIYLSLQAVIE